jgi:lipopolysaccharide transport system permease protein
MMFAGLIVFQAFSDCLNKAPKLIVANPNFVKKVVFPLEILPIVLSISSLVQLSIAIGLWLVGYALLFGIPPATALYAPLLLVAFMPTLLAAGWLLASLGVVIRDIDHITGLLSRALLFVTPVFYSLEAVPASLRTLFLANPLTFIVEQFRLVLFVGSVPDLFGVLAYFLIAALVSFMALIVFRRLRPIFADNL